MKASFKGIINERVSYQYNISYMRDEQGRNYPQHLHKLNYTYT